MGLFKKTKKEDNVYQETNENLQKIKDETESEIGKLESEIQEKDERLSIILDKIELSKKEYDEIVGKIIQSKKELRALGTSQVNTNETRMNNQSTDDISKDISDSKIELKNIQDDIAKKIEINKELDEKIKKNQTFFSNSENQKKKIEEELEQRKKELEILNKKLGGMKKTHIKNEGSDDSKNVVEAASQIVATTNKRLQDTMKELDIVRQLLDKERKAHNETKKKL